MALRMPGTTGRAISVCYEYLEEIMKTLPSENAPKGITRSDAMIGQFFYVFAHEFGHAAFDIFAMPIFGNEEDAADQFATYVMLQFGKDDARRLITGAAFAYERYVQNPQVSAPLAAFSDVHAPPAQRYFNMLCLAYGADEALFADVVERGYLPKTRARNCKREYNQVAFAFRDLVTPHLDQQLARQVLDKAWLAPSFQNARRRDEALGLVSFARGTKAAKIAVAAMPDEVGPLACCVSYSAAISVR